MNEFVHSFEMPVCLERYLKGGLRCMVGIGPRNKKTEAAKRVFCLSLVNIALAESQSAATSVLKT